MANKLPRERADIIINSSIEEASVTGRPLGTIIWKALTLKQISNIIHPDKDIFYIKDDEKVIQMFNQFCVEDSDESSKGTVVQ